MVSKVALFLDELLPVVEAKSGDITLNVSAQSRVAMALASTIFAQTRSAVTLLHAAHLGGVEVVVRSNLEAYVHLKNVLDDAAYVHRMEANYLSQQVSLFKQALEGKNQYLQGLAANKEAKEVFDKQDARMKELQQTGSHPINGFQRFEKAGMEDLYITAYNHLSAHSHQDLGALTRRYISQEGGVIRLRLHPTMDRDEIELIVDSMAGMLATSTIWIHRHFNSPHIALFEGLGEYLENLRHERDGIT
jgi:hypothetical protein